MHPNMWLNAATQENVAVLRARGITVIEPDIGRLTGKDSGIGRFPETATIISMVQEITKTYATLENKRVLVTAGGTREAIDPVRYIGNRSSGRQGLAIAYEALRAGAEVTVIAGATDPFELEGARVISTETADQMRTAVLSEFPQHDALVMSAAVADAKPATFSDEKIKKENLAAIDLVKNADVLAEAAQGKRSNQVIVGFAAETHHDSLKLGEEKMLRKGADFLYVNNVGSGAIFGEQKTTGTLIGLDIAAESFSSVDKHDVAKSIIRHVASRLERVHG
jgi:phosphopantothenoylcysteine decarboxylase/phosphopantothenate--cysteine ligase